MRHVVFALFLPSAVLADPTMECWDASSQVEIGSCVGEAEARVSKAVEASYGLAMRAAEELDEITERLVAQPALEAAQDAWVAYRDAHCEAVGASFGGGSGTGIAITACRVDLGRARVDQLLDYAN